MCIKGDGDDAVSVSDYVSQLHTDLRQQPAHERRQVDWRSAGQQCVGIGSGYRLPGCIIHVLNSCSLYWNDLLYDICVLCVVLRFVAVASCVCVCVTGDLPNSSASASAPAIGFVVAL